MVNPLIKDLQEVFQKDVALVGGKAANLGDLARGLRVPSGFCLTSEAYLRHLNQSKSQQKILDLLWEVDLENLDALNVVSEKIRRIILESPFNPEVEKAIGEKYLQFRAEKDSFLVAVRSSATAEDRPDASFAGQQESYLNVDGLSDVLAKVKECWASLWTPRAIHYRAKKGYENETVRMAVIIQEMLPAQISGVMFTANPVNNSRREILIEATRGLGEAIVSGHVTGESYTISKDGFRLLAVTGADPAKGPMFTELQLKQLALYGDKIEQYYESHQDVEWAYLKGEFYFLQTRPITTLADEEAEEIQWDKLSQLQKEILTTVSERFPEPIYPIDGEVTKLFFAAQFENWERMGYRVGVMDWSRVEKGMFPEFFVPPTIKPGWRQLFAFLGIGKVLGSDPSGDWRRESQHLTKMLKFLKGKKLNDFPYDIVHEYLEDALKELHLFLMLRYKFFAKNRMPSSILLWFLKRLFGREAKEIHDNLLAGIPCLTLEINQKLRQLAQQAKGLSEVNRALLEVEVTAMEERLAGVKGGSEYLSAFREFMDVYGDRETSIGLGGLGVTTWREAPEVVWGILKGMVKGGIETDLAREQALHRRREEAERRLNERLSQGIWSLLPVKGLVSKLVEHNRSFAAFREDSHFDLTRALSVYRILFLELGRRFVRQGLLDDPKDIMYLSFYELKDVIYEMYHYIKINQKVFRHQIAESKAFYQRRLARWRARGAAQEAADGALQGVPSSSGVVAGPVRIINDPREFYKLKPGDIMVAPYTNPTWTPLFASAVGIVVDTGGAASHAAIIAREYGIPAVMGVPGASKVLKDGEIITVNGSLGTVVREEEKAPEQVKPAGSSMEYCEGAI
ncbi:MAG: PEP-utilizing enzyme [Clostridia bacterium]|nr:PEP-utilizing enzyme [Clostridia bacterium]